MILVIDSGAGGRAIYDILHSRGHEVSLIADIDNFPYGDKSPEFLSNRINRLMSGYTGAELTVIGCNTASLCLDSEGSILRILPTPCIGDQVLGSKLTSGLVDGADASTLISYIQSYYLGYIDDKAMRTYIKESLSKYKPGSRLYLGCTHFSYVKDLMESERPDIIFSQPDYASLVERSLRDMRI